VPNRSTVAVRVILNITETVGLLKSLSGTLNSSLYDRLAQFPTVDPNTDFSLVNVVVAFYCSRSVAVVATALHPPNDINGQWTAALGAIEGDEPTVVAVQIKVSLINNTESGTIESVSFQLFSKLSLVTDATLKC